jgi:hypothetical protein
MSYPTGFTYKGSILKSRYRHGKGTLFDANKNVVFEGEFAYDEPSNG